MALGLSARILPFISITSSPAERLETIASLNARLAARLKVEGREVLVIDGSLTQAQVEEVVAKFNAFIRTNTKDGGALSKEIVLLTNQRGLTWHDYQGRLNFMLFDPSLPEALLRQSGGRVGRTIQSPELAAKYNLKVGGTYESAFKLYLEF